MAEKHILELRQATPRDQDFAWTVWSETVKPHIAPYIESRFKRPWKDDEEKRRFVEWWRADASSIILYDGAPAGWLAAEESPEKIVLHNFCVAPKYRERGIGGKILEAKLGEWKPQRKTITHSVLKKSDHASFFDRFGFRTTGEDDIVVFMELPRSG